MKKLISLVLTFSMLFTFVVPMSGYAKEDTELKSVITKAKTIFTVPDNFTEFNYYIQTSDNKKVWNLTWNSKNSSDGSMSVSLDDKGTIYSYYIYKYDSNSQSNLPKVSKQDALKIANNFITKINPTLVNKIKYVDDNNATLSDINYNFSYIRIENNIPVANGSYYGNNSVSVSVSRTTGEIQSYNYNWIDDLVFPSSEKVITISDAEKAYQDKLGLELMYNYRIEKDKIVTYLAYGPKYNNYSIDAITGDKVEVSGIYPYPYMKNDLKSTAEGIPGISFTPQEVSAIDEASNILSSSEVEKIARNCKYLGLTDDFKLSSTSLFKDWVEKGSFTWSLEFMKQSSDSLKGQDYVNVRIDAKNGEIENFYTNTPSVENAVAKYDEKASKEIAENFLKDFAKDKFASTEYSENDNLSIIRPLNDTTLPLDYSFKYDRLVNGIPFPSNGLTVGIDAVSGKVISFDSVWYNAEFASPKNVISIDKAYDKMFKDIGLELEYTLIYNQDANKKLISALYPQQAKPEVKIVYSVNPKKPLLIDAFKNILLNSDGKPFVENSSLEYTDIDNSFAKIEISKLAEFGIGFKGSEFKPNDNITQKDFMYLLSKAFYSYDITDLSNNEDIDKMYDILIRDGIIKNAEKAPSSIITREESIKYIIRQMKLDKVADIKDIYKCDFKDTDVISPELLGYVAIAKGLNIISGDQGYFRPNDKLTRGEAAVIIYNLLNR